MSEGSFVQACWDPSDPERWERKLLIDVTRETSRSGRRRGTSGATLAQKIGSRVYGFGGRSESLLRTLGLQVTHLEDGVATDEPTGWHRKLLCIRDALSDGSDQVVWLDFDAIQLREVPEDFWERLENGPPIQARIRQYKRVKCTWRRCNPRTLQGNAFLYCRSLELVNRLLEIMGQGPTWDDEKATAYLIDQLCGGWPGTAGYHALGYDPPWYTIRGEIWPCERPVFTAR